MSIFTINQSYDIGNIFTQNIPAFNTSTTDVNISNIYSTPLENGFTINEILTEPQFYNKGIESITITLLCGFHDAQCNQQVFFGGFGLNTQGQNVPFYDITSTANESNPSGSVLPSQSINDSTEFINRPWVFDASSRPSDSPDQNIIWTQSLDGIWYSDNNRIEYRRIDFAKTYYNIRVTGTTNNRVDVIRIIAGSSGTCNKQDYRNIQLSINVIFRADFCDILSLENNAPYCISYCRSNEGLNTCFNDYNTFCLNGVNGTPRIVTNTTCQNFYKTRIQNPNFGPDAGLDSVLNSYCTDNFNGFRDLEDSDNQTVIDLCACNLNNELYNELTNSLRSAFPDFTDPSRINARCYYPACVLSPYKNTSTGIVCPVPNCLNIVGIRNDGTFEEVNINIDQTGTCVDIFNEGGDGTDGNTGNGGNGTGNGGNGTGGNGTGGNGDTEDDERNFFQKYWWIFLLGGILLIVVIIIIVLSTRKS